MRGKTIVAGAFAVALFGFAGAAQADDGDEEITTLGGKKIDGGDGRVQVIVINQGDERRTKRKKRMAAIDGERPPEGYHVETQTLRGVWIAGVSLLSAGYFVTILAGGIADAVHGHDEGNYVYQSLLPVAGPFWMAGSGEISAPGKVPLILLGVIQGAGAGMLIGGLASKKDIWVPDAASTEPQFYVGFGSLGMVQNF